ncbi:hypothetical protein D8S78_23585 [Natrialba swarupiae]|nr:hypothetical protein [Natrialba swarupiae]
MLVGRLRRRVGRSDHPTQVAEVRVAKIGEAGTSGNAESSWSTRPVTTSTCSDMSSAVETVTIPFGISPLATACPTSPEPS